MIDSINIIESVATWHEFHKRARSPFFTGLFLGGAGIRKSDFPFDNRVKYFGMFCDHVAISIEEKLNLRVKAIEYLKQDPSYLTKLMARAYQEHAEAKARWKLNNQKDLASFSQKEFSVLFAEYLTDLEAFGIYVTLPLFVEDYFESVIKKEFVKRFGQEADRWFGVAVDPIKDGTVLEEEIARLALQPGDTEALQKHIEKFSWMANTGFFEQYYDIGHYQKLISEETAPAARHDELISARKKHQEEFSELLAKLSDDSSLIDLVKAANEAVFFRSYRTEMFYSSPAYNQSLLGEAAKRVGLMKTKELVWLYGSEVIELLSSGANADKDCIERRKQGYVFLSEFDGEFHSWDGQEAKTALAAYLKEESHASEVTELKGSGAFLGKVSGKAVVLKDVNELHKVTGGEILITHATNVNFVPALKKVIGIVTEEGGILSHAAIISRELRIPCVIGTQIGTQVFKDGDVVEVDAQLGIVRKL